METRNIPELLKKFRKTEYYHRDVLWHDLRVKILKPILTEKLVNLSEAEFKNLLQSEWFMQPRIPQQIDEIIKSNGLCEIKLRLLNLFLGQSPINERLQAVLDLRGIGLYIASQLLSAVDNDYIIYHEKVLEGIRDILPDLEDILPNEISDAEKYLYFNEICKSIKDTFGFKSLGEVHEFFWHGHDTNWEF